MKFAVPFLVFSLFSLPLFSQTDFESTLSRHKTNKVVLLGEWKASDTAKWREIINSDGIYEHDFALLDRRSLGSGVNPLRNLDAFERWFTQYHSLSGSATWAALDIENKLLFSGSQTPSAREFDQMLEQRGIRSPLRKVRDFLRENPGHLDAMADLLTEVRRRALHAMPEDISEDLDDESDLRTWAVMAAETDRVFSGSWLGVDLNFFRPDQEQPERFSKLMKKAFQKHIASVESSIRLEPANNTLWNIWAWMARSLPDYDWKIFANSFEPYLFRPSSIRLGSISTPSSEVCVWIVEESRAKNDWDTVIKFARVARQLSSYMDTSLSRSEWLPGGGVGMSFWPQFLECYPAKSAYAPHLEALLKKGDLEGANAVYDEMIRIIGKESQFNKSNNALIAAEVARAAGMEELAALWEKGEPTTKIPYVGPISSSSAGLSGNPFFYLSGNFSTGPGAALHPYFKEFSELNNKLSHRLLLTIRGNNALVDSDDKLGWKADDPFGWALVSEDGRVLAHDTAVTSLDAMQSILSRFNIRSETEIWRKYMIENSNPPGLELMIAMNIVNSNILMLNSQAQPIASSGPDGISDETLWEEATRLIGRALSDNPDILVNIPTTASFGRLVDSAKSILAKSLLLKTLSWRMLANIEALLERKPASENLWYQWIFWNAVEDSELPMDSIVDRAKPSPLSQAGTVPPVWVIDAYYEDCKKIGNWPKAINLLKAAWDREFARVTSPGDSSSVRFVNKGSIGDRIGIPLIEAYLQDNKPGLADEIFNAVLDCGGEFTNISKIAELAKEKGQDRLLREWEGKIGK